MHQISIHGDATYPGVYGDACFHTKQQSSLSVDHFYFFLAKMNDAKLVSGINYAA